MKIKTWIRRLVSSSYIEDKQVRNLLFTNGIYSFFTYKEQILEIDIINIIDPYNIGIGQEPGYMYSNRLYDLVHKKSMFVGEKDDLEYEIIEDGYPDNIPYSYCVFKDAEEFHKWMLEEGKKK